MKTTLAILAGLLLCSLVTIAFLLGRGTPSEVKASPPPAPKYGWASIREEGFDMDPTALRIFQMAQRTGKLRMRVESSEAVNVSFIDRLGENAMVVASEAEHSTCRSVDSTTTSIEGPCLNRKYLVVQDSRTPEGTIFKLVFGAWAHAGTASAISNNKVKLVMEQWRCIENCT